METRLLLYKSGCPFCLEYLRIIDKINKKLPIDKRIKLLDSFESENLKMPPNAIADKLTPEGFNAFPFLYIDGTVIEPGGEAPQLKIMLDKYLKEDYIY